MDDTKEVNISKPFAEISRVDDLGREIQNRVRLYKSAPWTYTLQIRVFGKLNRYGKAKKRNMIASVHVTREELEQLAAYAAEY